MIVLLDSDKSGDDVFRGLRRGPRNKPLIEPKYVLYLGDLSNDRISITPPTRVVAIEDLIPLEIGIAAVKHYADHFLHPDGFAVQAGSITGGVHFPIPAGGITSPGPAFELRHRQGFRYLLVNIGSATAKEVVMDLGDHGEGLTRDVPRGIRPTPGSAHSVLLGGSAQTPPPVQISVSCAELVQPVPLIVPPYR